MAAPSLSGVTAIPTSLTLLTQDDLVLMMAQAWGAALGITPILPSGSPALAIFQADATQGAYLIALGLAIAQAARLSTSTGGDVDTFVADFGLARLPATLAQGPVTLSALTAPAVNVQIPAGTVIQVPGGAIQYQLIADTSQSAWSATLNAYVLPAGTTSITATAKALLAGTAYNVQAAMLTQFATSVAGIDTVSNAAAIINALDVETDAALKARFLLFLSSLSKATKAAILFAVNSVQQGLQVQVLENINQAGNAQNGFFTVLVAANGAAPGTTLINTLVTAINAIRAFTVNFGVQAPAFVTANVALTLELVTSPTEANATIILNVQNAITAYINGLGMTVSAVPLLKLGQVAIDADANVASITPGKLTINSVAADLAITSLQMPIAGAITVTT